MPARTLKNLGTTQAHLRHGFKTGLAAVLAWAITWLAGLPYGFWAVVTAVVVMQINVADSIRLCTYRLTGTALGAVIGIAAILAFPETQAFTIIGLFLSVGFCAYMTRYNQRFHMAAITVTIVFLSGVGEEGRVAFALYRVLEIIIGIACAFGVSILLWPVRAGETLSRRLAGQLERSAEASTAIMEAFLAGQRRLDKRFLDELGRDVAGNREIYLKVLKHERIFYNFGLEELSARVELASRILQNLRGMLNILNDVNEMNQEGEEIIMAPELRDLARATADAMRYTARGEFVDRELLGRTLRQVEERFKELRGQGVTRRFSLPKLLQVFSFINNAIQLGQLVLRASGTGEAVSGTI